jgi:hypothetical protein
MMTAPSIFASWSFFFAASLSLASSSLRSVYEGTPWAPRAEISRARAVSPARRVVSSALTTTAATRLLSNWIVPSTGACQDETKLVLAQPTVVTATIASPHNWNR